MIREVKRRNRFLRIGVGDPKVRGGYYSVFMVCPPVCMSTYDMTGDSRWVYYVVNGTLVLFIDSSVFREKKYDSTYIPILINKISKSIKKIM